MADGSQGEPISQTPQGGIVALLADPALDMAVIPMPRIGADPPTEILAFRWGENPTTKGVLRLTYEGARKALANRGQRGVVLCFDYFHATYDPNVRPKDKEAAGHCRLALRDQGIAFVDIQWTPEAAQAIRDGKWPYASPVVLHDKDGVIVGFKNPALVTDPGTLRATPLILSGADAGPAKGQTMADKKRLVLDAYSSLQTTLKRCQALADTDGQEKDLGNGAVGKLAMALDAFAAYIGPAGYLEEATLSAKAAEAREAMVCALEAEIGEADPVKLRAKLEARLDGKSAPAPTLKGVLLSDGDAATVTKLLVDGHSQRIPTSRRDGLLKQGPAAVAAYLSAATDITPKDAPREAAPLPPTSANVEAALKDAPKPALPGASPKTLADCTPQQRIQVDAQVEAARLFMGASFNEALETEHALASLSAEEPVSGSSIRHLPHGIDPSTGRATVATGGIL